MKPRRPSFVPGDVERAETAAATLVVAGLTGINAYESTDPDNTLSDGLTA